jgi:hypothetical protein
VVKKSVSAWLERGVVKKVSFSMSGKSSGSKVSRSMSEKECDKSWHFIHAFGLCCRGLEDRCLV